MELYQEIMSAACVQGLAQIDAEKIVKLACYQTLSRIKAIVEDDTLDDPECFQRIEQIVCSLEDIGSNGGFRHDF